MVISISAVEVERLAVLVPPHDCKNSAGRAYDNCYVVPDKRPGGLIACPLFGVMLVFCSLIYIAITAINYKENKEHGQRSP